MGSLMSGWDSPYTKPKGVEEFDDALRPNEPDTAGANYQRQLMKKYLSRGTPVLPPELSRKSEPVMVDTPPSLKRDSTGSGGVARSPTLMRTGSLRMPMRSTSLPTSPRSVVTDASEDAEEAARDKAGWWSRMDSAQMNRQVEEGDDHYLGSYKPQFDVAGNAPTFAKGTESSTK